MKASPKRLDLWSLGAAVLFFTLTLVLAIAAPAPMPPPVASAPLTDFAAYQSGADPAPIVTYSDGDRTLTVTEHAPRDLLVCLRGDCRLVEEWLERQKTSGPSSNGVRAGHGGRVLSERDAHRRDQSPKSAHAE